MKLETLARQRAAANPNGMQAAVIRTRDRMGDPDIGVTVKAGRFQIVRATPEGRTGCRITELSGWLETQDAVIAALGAL